jgi:hypothetical protein
VISTRPLLKTTVLLAMVLSSNTGFADDFKNVGKIFREVCFERAKLFDEAEVALKEFGAERTSQKQSCIGGASTRLSQWSLPSTSAVKDLTFTLADAPAASDGNPTRYVCGFTAVTIDSEKLGKATVSALSGLWDKGRPQKDDRAQVKTWLVLRKGAGAGLATSAIHPDKFEFNMAFEKALEPCSETE